MDNDTSTARKIIELWDGLLKTISGDLYPINIFYYKIDFKWSTGKIITQRTMKI